MKYAILLALVLSVVGVVGVNDSNCTMLNVSVVLDLVPSESKVGNVSNCLYEVTCGSCAEVNETGICSVDKVLNPGGYWDRQTSSCDLSFECNECQESECSDYLSNFTFINTLRIEKAENNITLTFGDEKPKTFPADFDFSYDIDFPQTCPYYNKTIYANFTKEQCRSIYSSELLDDNLVSTSFKVWTNQMGNMGNTISNCTEKLAACYNEKSSLEENSCNQNEWVQRSEHRNCLNKAESCERLFNEKSITAGIYKVAFWIMLPFFILILSVMMYYIIKNRGEE